MRKAGQEGRTGRAAMGIKWRTAGGGRGGGVVGRTYPLGMWSVTGNVDGGLSKLGPMRELRCILGVQEQAYRPAYLMKIPHDDPKLSIAHCHQVCVLQLAGLEYREEVRNVSGRRAPQTTLEYGILSWASSLRDQRMNARRTDHRITRPGLLIHSPYTSSGDVDRSIARPYWVRFVRGCLF